jgi:hypothetical protein
MKDKIKVITEALLADVLHQETAQDQYNSLVRLEKGANAILMLLQAEEMLSKGTKK